MIIRSVMMKKFSLLFSSLLFGVLMWPGGARADTCTAASQNYFSWHNWGATAWNMTGYPDYVRPRNLQSQGECRISAVYALIQAAEINYRFVNRSILETNFTGHENPPDVNAIRVDFSEESARSAYFQEQGVEMACNEDVDPVDFVEVLGHHGYPDYQYHRTATLIPIDASNSLLIGKTNATTLRAYKITVSGSTGTITTVGSLFNTTSFDAAWEQTTPSVLITIFTNTAGKVRKYTTNGTSLTFRYELNLNVPVHSVARTDLGSVAILGNEVFKLGESTPTVTVLGAYPDLPADLNGFTLVPRTSLRLWGKGGDGKLDGYQYYPQLGEWETVQCLQRLD